MIKSTIVVKLFSYIKANQNIYTATPNIQILHLHKVTFLRSLNQNTGSGNYGQDVNGYYKSTEGQSYKTVSKPSLIYC